MATNFALKQTPSASQDIFFDAGQIAFVVDKDYTAQRIKTRLQVFYGEWKYDTSQGVPWIEEVLIKPANLVTIQAIIKNTIINTPTVTSITSYQDNFNRSTRGYSVTFTVTSENGNITDSATIV